MLCSVPESLLSELHLDLLKSRSIFFSIFPSVFFNLKNDALPTEGVGTSTRLSIYLELKLVGLILDFLFIFYLSLETLNELFFS